MLNICTYTIPYIHALAPCNQSTCNDHEPHPPEPWSLHCPRGRGSALTGQEAAATYIKQGRQAAATRTRKGRPDGRHAGSQPSSVLSPFSVIVRTRGLVQSLVEAYASFASPRTPPCRLHSMPVSTTHRYSPILGFELLISKLRKPKPV